MRKRIGLILLALILVLPITVAGDTPVKADSYEELARLNAAHKQTGVYITRLREYGSWRWTPYQRSRYNYWLAKRADYKARYMALREAIRNPADPGTPPVVPSGYVANADCWDNPCHNIDQSVWQFSNALGQYSVMWPQGTGTNRPVYVLIPGGPLAPGTSGLAGMERYIAQRGGVAFRADYRSQRQYDGGSPMAYQDVACAIRGARIEAPKYGGDPNRITLIAHSFGGWIAWHVVLGDWAPTSECKYQTGNWRPDQYVNVDAIANTSQIGSHFRETDYPDSFVVEQKVQTAARKIPVIVVWGTGDLVARINIESPILYDNLLTHGWPVKKVEIVGADHSYPLIHDDTLDMVLGGRP